MDIVEWYAVLICSQYDIPIRENGRPSEMTRVNGIRMYRAGSEDNNGERSIQVNLSYKFIFEFM